MDSFYVIARFVFILWLLSIPLALCGAGILLLLYATGMLGMTAINMWFSLGFAIGMIFTGITYLLAAISMIWENI